MDTDQEVIEIFENCGALTQGHFILRSGLRSGHFFQCARVGEDLKAISRLAELLIEKLKGVEAKTVLAPAMGGLVFGQEVARQLGLRFIFAEKVDDRLALRRSFKMEENEPILIIEDVITRGGRVDEAVKIVEDAGAKVAAIGLMVDRSAGNAKFDAPLYPLMKMNFPTYQPDEVPEELAKIPAIKPGS